MSEEKVAPKKPAMVHVKNNGIRHRLIHPEHGNHVWESGDTRAIPADLAASLCADYPDMEPVKADGTDLGEFKAGLEAEKKTRKERHDRVAAIREQERKDADAAEEAMKARA